MIRAARKESDILEDDFKAYRLEEYVWEENGRVSALLSIGNTADADKDTAFEVWRIYLSPEMQGKGVGGQLLAYAEQRAKEKGYSEIVIWVFRENIRAIAFYQKHGYHSRPLLD